MRTVRVNGLEIGPGKPKIAVPLVETTTAALVNAAKRACQEPIDMVEWRLDFFANIHSNAAIHETARKLHQVLGSHPLLVTLRTKEEGGNYQFQLTEYLHIYQELIKSHLVDLIDIEVLRPTTAVLPLVRLAHEEQVKVIMSNHDFCKTPPAAVLQERIEQMTNLGADIAKFAVMPRSREDLLTILSTSLHHADLADGIPLVAIGMGQKGKIIRIGGEIFGSCISFGTVGKASAPGQLAVTELSKIFDVLHE
ncbi:type I 3-dehydroquinate dehydratase [Limosilactobacillus sp. STM2_1]|uniref:3-dehydroquinate dehydratase n=1 Tax=Limosilactobacillus rudii TaxID=2759755 RepID=A0A7W3YNJ6_9LACO|nr:type I 3-dehydroquinate dehydratase [Limosilactobacillus rudii]MBB1079647.1 type I 3-dehydroquinate dehydratase [Limosilactobacillus rudii]MBB1097725.1 type I 3-dehydroquinate dehydratase [Limosilactobacillus rudii]MCD7134363.1 type I 3-dehydroquinate dehydratase [Limosilactobacillus rudii]